MRAPVMHGAGDVRIENVPDPSITDPTDALVRVTHACICGSDLWPYKTLEYSDGGRVMGHEAIGVIEAVGSSVRNMKAGDLVVMPFAFSDGTCEFCHDGLQTACLQGGFFGNAEVPGAQAEALRVPFADGTLYPLPVGEDDALLPSLLTLSDVMGTGHHAAVAARVAPGKRVAVVGDGAVGLCGVIAAKRLGAEQIILLGRHPDRGARRLSGYERPRVDQGDGGAMTGAAWTADELDRIGHAEGLEIAPGRSDGSLRRAVPIWVVRVGEELYIRSWRGDSGSWYR